MVKVVHSLERDNRYDKYYLVLGLCNSSPNISRTMLMQKINSNYAESDNYIDLLVTKGLVVHTTQWHVTDAGIEFMVTYRMMKRVLGEGD